MIDFDIRLSCADDSPFIMDSWFKTARHTYPNQYDIDFQQNFPARIERLLSCSMVLVAHLAGEPNELLGYLVYNFFQMNRVVHMCYVKADARRIGIMRALLKFCEGDTPHPLIFTTPAKSENLMTFLSSRYLFCPGMGRV